MLKRIPHVNKIISREVEDEAMINRLGKFDLVYSTFSLHHWEDHVRAIQTAETDEPTD